MPQQPSSGIGCSTNKINKYLMAMEKQAYQVKQLVFATKATTHARAHEYEDQLKINLTPILTCIEQALSAFDQIADIYCIPLLEIDMGKLSRPLADLAWLPVFRQQLEQALNKVWCEQRYTRIPVGPGIEAWRLFNYYIQYGTWPWWGQTKPSLRLASLWEKIWPSHAAKVIQLFQHSLQQEYWLQRFIYHLSDQQLNILLQAVHNQAVLDLADFYQQIHRLSSHLPSPWHLTEAVSRETYWRLCIQLFAIAPAVAKAEQLLAEYLNHLAVQLQQPYSLLLSSLALHAAQANKNTELSVALQKLTTQQTSLSNINNIQWLVKALNKLLGPLTTSAQPAVYLASLTQLNQQLRFLQQQSLTSHWERPLQNLQQALQHLLNTLQDSLTDVDLGTIRSASEKTWFAAKGCQDMLPLTAINNPVTHPQVSHAEGYLIPYAGAILLHPFLPFLFQHCQLVNNQRFIQESELQKALLLIHFLATHEVMPAEHELILAKLFCGLPVDEPLQLTEQLTTEQTQQATALLAVVRERWTILKNSTDQGLRSAFLQRPGILKKENDLWYLRLEKQGCDALLDKLPWSLSPVRSPWMQTHLVVEWR
jgi:hypothetical protein